jgi:predicted DNA-binding transcriptional regulator
MQSLVKSPAWALLVEYARQQVHNNEQEIRQPLEAKISSFADKGIALDGALLLGMIEFDKGWIGGIQCFLGIPQTLIEANKAIITSLEETEDGPRNDTGNDPDRNTERDLGDDAGHSAP